MQIVHVVAIGSGILDPLLCKPFLPYFELGSEAKRKSSLDELHRFFNRDIRRRGDDEMDMIRHKNESMKLISAFPAVFPQKIKEQFRI